MPSFIAVAVLSLGIMGPLFAAIMFTDDIAKIATIVSEIGEVLDQPELNRPDKPAPTEGFGIELHDVGFSYGSVPVLKDVSLSIEQGSTVALVGPSGSGKSTIAKLIASLWDVGSGSLLIGGTDVREMPLSQVAHLVAYVSQDNFLFDDSVMENIRAGRTGATDDEVIACAKASGCHEFIEGLSQGYGTVVGGAGGHLSGGERQRVALARAMMKDAPIVVLDEATAYADPENEAVIQEAVGRLTEGRPSSWSRIGSRRSWAQTRSPLSMTGESSPALPTSSFSRSARCMRTCGRRISPRATSPKEGVSHA